MRSSRSSCPTMVFLTSYSACSSGCGRAAALAWGESVMSAPWARSRTRSLGGGAGAAAGRGDGDGEPDPDEEALLAGVRQPGDDPDHLAGLVKRGAAGVPGVNGGVDRG